MACLTPCTSPDVEVVTGAMANLTQLHEARSQWEDIPSEENGDTKPDDLAVAGQDVGDGA
jgi:hypothetical protein